jgi:ribulose-phosphate 3-epimerase
MEVGIALDIDPPVEAISEEVYHMVDLVLILAAKAGSSGQEFNPKALDKISRMRKIVGNLVEVGVDCGLDEKTIPLCKQAGASVFYVNSAFWNSPDLGKRYNELTLILNNS